MDRRQPHSHTKGKPLEWYSGSQVGFEPPKIPATVSWWTSAADFYAKAKQEAARMNQGSGVAVVEYLRRQMGEER